MLHSASQGGDLVFTSGDYTTAAGTAPASNFSFRWAENGSVNTLMTIGSSGNVGIGIASPQHPLDLGDSLGAKLAVYQNASGNSFYGFGISGSTLEIHSSSATGATSEAKMVVKADGNVGIGTTSPSTKLYVNGGQAIINNSGSDNLFRIVAGGYTDYNKTARLHCRVGGVITGMMNSAMCVR